MLKSILENLLIIYLIPLVALVFIVPMICDAEGMGARNKLLVTILYPIWFIPIVIFYFSVLIHGLWTNSTLDKSWDIMMSKKIFLKIFGKGEGE